MKKKSLITLSVLITICFSVFSQNSSINFKKISLDFKIEELSLVQTEYKYNDDYTTAIKYDPRKYFTYQTTGEPALPRLPVNLFIPENAVFKNVNITYDKTLIGTNIIVEPVQNLIPFSKPDHEFKRVEPNEEVYGSNLQYPKNIVDYSGTHEMSRYKYFSFNISPLMYYPSSGELYIAENLMITINYVLSGQKKTARWDDGTFINMMKNLVINPDDLPDTGFREPRADDVKYLIVTSSDLEASFAPLAAWKTQKGMPAEIVTTDYIYSNYSGSSNQLKIKACIEDYYTNKGTVFAVLGGDNTEVPDYDVYGTVNQYEPEGQFVEDNTIPGDLFYGCFDNAFDWNEDGDNQAGESVDNCDYAPEVFIARIPVRSTADVNAYVNKALDYETDPATSNFAYKLLLTGLKLFDDNDAEGHSDAQNKSQKLLDEYVTPYWNGDIYEYYDTYSDFAETSVTSSGMANRYDEGYNLHHMATHGSETAWSMDNWGSFSSTNASNLNNAKQGNIVTIACNTNAFESADPCLSEAFLRNANGGSVTYLGASRYGLGESGHTIHGPSFRLNDMFFQYLFTGEPSDDIAIYKFGAVTAMARNYFISEISIEENDGMRWSHYNLNPCGDPELDIFTNDPTAISVTAPSEIPVGNAQVTVQTDVPGALVCIMNGLDVYVYGYADNSGNYTCMPTPSDVGELTLTVTAHNRIPNISTITVIPNEGPWISYESYSINDPAGNNNSLADYDEDITLDVTLVNVGLADANNVDATLSTTDSYINITDNLQSFGTISAETNSTQTQAYAITIADDIPDQHEVIFELAISDGTDNWTSQFTMILNAPVLAIEDENVVSGVYLSDEEYTIIVNNLNNGHSASKNATCVITTTSNDVTITEGTFDVGILDISANEQAMFCIQINSGLSPGTPIPLTFSLTAGTYSEQAEYTLNVFCDTEDFESGGFTSLPWVVTGTNTSEAGYWQIMDDDPYSGSFSAKTGTLTSSGNNDPNTFNRAILTIDINVTEAGQSVSFYKKVSCEPGEGDPYDWYDFLSFDIDGTIEGQWDGEDDWSMESYPVSEGTHTLTWTYEKDGYVDEGGDCAWLDEISLPISPEDDPGCYTNNMDDINITEKLSLNIYPNPASYMTTIEYSVTENTKIRLSVLNILGEEIFIPVDNKEIEAGYYCIDIDCSNLKPGIYFCRISSGNGTCTEKLIIAK